MQQAIINSSRTDKFLLVLDLPVVLKKMQDDIIQTSYKADQVQYTAFGSPVPEIHVPSITLPYGGQSAKATSGSRSPYHPLDVLFVVDNGYQNYWILNTWLNQLNDQYNSTSNMSVGVGVPNQPIKLNNPVSEFNSSFTTFGLDEYDKPIISFTYSNAFITKLSRISFSHQEPHLMTCTATFDYNQLHTKLLKDIHVSSC